MKKSYLYSSLLALGLFTVGHASAVPVVANGSFEDPAYGDTGIHSGAGTGWTPSFMGRVVVVSGNIQDIYGNLYGATPYGSQYLGIDKRSNQGFLSRASQTISGFEAGQAYELTLYVADSDGGTFPILEVSLFDPTDGDITYLDRTYSVPFGGPYGDTIQFNKVVIPFTAPVDGDITLSLTNASAFNGPPASFSIDNVSIAVVPEPSPGILLAGGVGLLLGGQCLRRLRRCV